MTDKESGKGAVKDTLVGPLLNFCKNEEELIPLRSTTLELVYGNMEYVRSVFGPKEVTRKMLSDYYQDAHINWFKCDFPAGVHRGTVTRWCRDLNIRPLHYYSPLGLNAIWFKDKEDSFAFKLKFG